MAEVRRRGAAEAGERFPAVQDLHSRADLTFSGAKHFRRDREVNFLRADRNSTGTRFVSSMILARKRPLWSNRRRCGRPRPNLAVGSSGQRGVRQRRRPTPKTGGKPKQSVAPSERHRQKVRPTSMAEKGDNLPRMEFWSGAVPRAARPLGRRRARRLRRLRLGRRAPGLVYGLRSHPGVSRSRRAQAFRFRRLIRCLWPPALWSRSTGLATRRCCSAASPHSSNRLTKRQRSCSRAACSSELDTSSPEETPGPLKRAPRVTTGGDHQAGLLRPSAGEATASVPLT